MQKLKPSLNLNIHEELFKLSYLTKSNLLDFYHHSLSIVIRSKLCGALLIDFLVFFYKFSEHFIAFQR